jgi:hypothetical protein
MTQTHMNKRNKKRKEKKTTLNVGEDTGKKRNPHTLLVGM